MINLVYALRFKLLRKTKKSRQQLRAQRLNLGGKMVSAATWIDRVSQRLPPYQDGKITHHDRMWWWYSHYDVKGLNLYLGMVKRKVKKQAKRIKTQ